MNCIFFVMKAKTIKKSKKFKKIYKFYKKKNIIKKFINKKMDEKVHRFVKKIAVQLNYFINENDYKPKKFFYIFT